MVRYITTLTLFSFILNMAFCQSDFKDLISQNEKAVFAIYSYDDFGVPNGYGTGFFITSSGIGITNYHILDGAAYALIKTHDKSTLRITEILEINPGADIIKFKVENNNGRLFHYLSSKTTPLQKGEEIIVISNPYGITSTVSEGIISSTQELTGDKEIIQISVPFSTGSSGSPVLTLDGNVIGITNFQYVDGEPYYFAMSANILNKLNPAKLLLSTNSNSNFIVINEKCKANSELVLNSIEFKDHETVLYFSFTNVSMGYGDKIHIWTELNNRDKTFFIQDLSTMKKYYAIGSSIGTSRRNGTEVSLGESKRFKVTFPYLKSRLSKVNIMEGIASSWEFMDLDLSKYFKIENQETRDFSLLFALGRLETKDFLSAKAVLVDRVQNLNADDDAYNILAIISYLLDNNYDALLFLSKAIDINPKNDIYYFNRFRINLLKKDDTENALKDISNAIQIRPNQGDYYQHRAYIYMAQKEWKKAITDLDLAINIMGRYWHLFKLRGYCKAWTNDLTGACKDWHEANILSENGDTELNEWITQSCK
jgi:serine protease Do